MLLVSIDLELMESVQCRKLLGFAALDLFAEVDDCFSEFFSDQTLDVGRDNFCSWWLEPEEIQVSLFTLEDFDLHLFKDVTQLDIVSL